MKPLVNLLLTSCTITGVQTELIKTDTHIIIQLRKYNKKGILVVMGVGGKVREIMRKYRPVFCKQVHRFLVVTLTRTRS